MFAAPHDTWGIGCVMSFVPCRPRFVLSAVTLPLISSTLTLRLFCLQVLKTRILELQKARDNAETRAGSLEKQTANWVPKEELLKMSHQHYSLNAKYAQLMAESSRKAMADIKQRDWLRDKHQLEQRYK